MVCSSEPVGAVHRRATPMIESRFQPGRLRLARELNSLTQAEVARRLDLTPAAVSQFESGAAQPTEATVARLSENLDVPEAFFHLPIMDTHDGFFRSLRRTGTADRRRARAVAHIAHDVVASSPDAGSLTPVSALLQADLTRSTSRRSRGTRCVRPTRLGPTRWPGRATSCSFSRNTGSS